MPITFHNSDVKFSLPQKKELKKFLEYQINSSSKRRVKISFIFCSDNYLLNINRQFLNHDYYTDIITFPLVNTPTKLEAEIYISVERVKENAGKYAKGIPKESAKAEMHRVIFHGVLHVLGYKDKTKPQQAKMRKAENSWLREYLG